MLHPHLRLRHLRVFLETARLGSLSAAAEVLHVSQPAASKTVRELEDILETQLFDRSGRRLALTRAGKVFQQHAGTAMADLERAERLLRDLPQHQRKLAIGVLPTAATGLFPDAAARFRDTYPDCTLRISTGPNWLLLSQLREGALDLVVGRMPATGTGEGLSFRQLYWERVVPVIRPGHPLQGREWEPAELLRYPLMLPPRGAVISGSVQSFLRALGLGEPIPAYENVSHAFGRRVVARSNTIWFISAGVVRAELDSGELTVLPVQNELLGGPVGISLRDGVPPDTMLQGLVDELIAVAAAYPSQGG